MKKNWDSKDNQAYIEQIIEYKQKIIDTSKIVQEKHSKKVMSKELVGEELPGEPEEMPAEDDEFEDEEDEFDSLDDLEFPEDEMEVE